MKFFRKMLFMGLATITYLFATFNSFASDEVVGIAKDWQIYTQSPATEIAERTQQMLHLLIILSIIMAIFVTALLIYVCFRYRASKNKVPSKTTHNTLLEIIWTVIPTLIVIALIVPSLKLIFFAGRTPDTEMTLKVVGYQWYWGYEYPDNGNIKFDAYMKTADNLKDGDNRLLDTDNQVVLPVDTNIRLLITSTDVIHAWTIPAFGVKRDAVPGRLNELWFNIKKPGIYYGQCSELCGQGHAFMPIVVKAVSKEEFNLWVEQEKQKMALKNQKNLLVKNNL